jgi:hypothetical protein
MQRINDEDGFEQQRLIHLEQYGTLDTMPGTA